MRDASETRRSAGRRAALRRLLPPNGEVDAAVGGLRIARRGRRSIQPPAMARRHRSATGLSRQTRWLAEGGSELRGSGQVGDKDNKHDGAPSSAMGTRSKTQLPATRQVNELLSQVKDAHHEGMAANVGDAKGGDDRRRKNQVRK